MMFAAAVGHRSGRATPSLRGAPQRQSMEIVRRETIYRNRNAVQTNPATSIAIMTTAPASRPTSPVKKLLEADIRCSRQHRAAEWHVLLGSVKLEHDLTSRQAMRQHQQRGHHG